MRIPDHSHFLLGSEMGGDNSRIGPHPADLGPTSHLYRHRSPGCFLFRVPGWNSFHNTRGTPALHLNEAADGSCCDAGLGLVWRCYWIYMSFVCLIQKKNICFGFLKGRGCVESKNKTSAKRKSTMSSLDPSIIQVASFKCRADVPLTRMSSWISIRSYRLLQL